MHYNTHPIATIAKGLVGMGSSLFATVTTPDGGHWSAPATIFGFVIPALTIVSLYIDLIRKKRKLQDEEETRQWYKKERQRKASTSEDSSANI